MEKHLYKCFDHWYRGGNIWLYSDPHFADEEMKWLRPNYIGDAEQVRKINAKVGKKDTLIILGDIGDIEWVRKLRGYKVLIMGNHDKGASNYEEVFDEVYDGPVMINNKIMLSHEPVVLPFIFNIHGHMHTDEGLCGNRLNVCAEHINYTPVSLITLLKNGVASKVPNIHRLAVDRATTRKRGKSDDNKSNLK